MCSQPLIKVIAQIPLAPLITVGFDECRIKLLVDFAFPVDVTPITRLVYVWRGVASAINTEMLDVNIKIR